MAKSKKKKKRNGDIRKLLSNDDKIQFISRLYELINHGYTLEDSIEFLFIQYNASKKLVELVKKDLSMGKKLSHILERLGYSASVVSKMEFAEYYGKIETMLLEIEKYLKIQKEQKEKIIQTIRYPFLLTLSLISLIMLFNILLIPQFKSIYESSNIQMDTEVIILMTLLEYLPYILIGIILMVSLIALYLTYTYKYKQDLFLKYITRMPFLNRYFRYFASYQYSLELSLFLSSGFSIKTCLDEMINKNYNYFFLVFSKDIEEGLVKGQVFENIIEKLPYFDQSMPKFISHGRKNSMLDKELKLFSEIMLNSFLKLIDSRLKRLQPILFLLLALIILALYLVILLPVFNMTTALR
ncbi:MULTISPECIES: competence type IV pilus assembly protein ComGB [unclassified Gemella]|uniref:competence type IV pilus assembly protein ComGB n=1 Tax=unclassified Gemella TaxID=2624949 RepID=UPI0015D01D5E|nr:MULTISPECIES: competence type IV pilus assembly protein ComGB [unclassified Gemella]MBF0709772.1 type II secretion system F family protein [Gemella sp. GL1.1]NYS27116.1 type II secretion system F family protein [Gemella sp. GL1]